MSLMRPTLFATIATLIVSGCTRETPSIYTSVSTPPLPAVMAESCPGATGLSVAHDRTVNAATFDEALLDSAVLHFTNVRRCANGVAPLAADKGLQRVASSHSADMARLRFFGHDSPVKGKSKLVDRLRVGTVRFRAAAENLAKHSRMQFEQERPFYVEDRASCQFSYQPKGAPIAPHSYRSLAQVLVQSWEESPGHRKNLFNAAYRRVGTGGRIGANPETCGDVYATQNFAA